MKALYKKPRLPMSTTGSFHHRLIHAADDQSKMTFIARQSNTGRTGVETPSGSMSKRTYHLPQVYPRRRCSCAKKYDLDANAIAPPLIPVAEVLSNRMHASAGDRKSPARQQDVLHFEISVVDALGMAVRKAIQQLCKQATCL